MSAQTNSTEFTLCPPMATLTIADAIEADKTIAVVKADITAQKGDSIDRLPARRIRWADAVRGLIVLRRSMKSRMMGGVR